MRPLRDRVLAEIRQSTGKRYSALERLLTSMSEAQLLDLLHLMRDVREQETSRMQGQARRMGLPPGVLR